MPAYIVVDITVHDPALYDHYKVLLENLPAGTVIK